MSARPPFPSPRNWRPLLELALVEDLGSGDVTTPLVLSEAAQGRARIEAREALVVCGLPIAAAAFALVDPELRFEYAREEAELAEAGAPLAFVSGNLRAILAAERCALNFLGRMCGVANSARQYVDAVAGTGARIVDTRKTLPGWRALDKYAAAVGGALNHRTGLFDGILLKDNHVALAGGAAQAVKAALAAAPAGLRVQIEVESEADAVAAVEAGADFLLLDNCPLPLLRAIVARVGDRALLEASGGVRLDNVRAIAETGVSRVSIGRITHSASAADVALEIEGPAPRSGAARA
jgi:nicotinate-nucleotide pyrophosphorylase (carboxylating)